MILRIRQEITSNGIHWNGFMVTLRLNMVDLNEYVI